ncbi:MAG TPA: gliding motility-associated protein GldE [Chitinophagaceae bacterium]|nr:gliding motility-associated protein GldE [Chitinophagaceae bacterium]
MDYHSAYVLFLQAQATFSATDITVLVIACLLLMVVSAVVSGAEIAFFSLDSKDLNMLKTRESNNARLIPLLLEKPRLLMTTLVITATIANIGIIFILNYLLELLVDTSEHMVLSLFVRIVIISAILLLCCEILPKIYATQNKLRMDLFATPLVQGLLNILQPVSSASLVVSDWLSDRIFGRSHGSFSAEDIDEAIALSVNQSASQEEKNMLRSIINFGQITAKQIMRGRLDVSGIEYDVSFKSLILKVGELHYSRLPVYKGNLDNIAGMIHTKDLLSHLNKHDDFDWHEIIRQSYYVPEQKLIEDLLKEFQTQRMHFAIVVDEFGGTSGIVTLEDIMEEIIGDIKDEFDEEEFYYKRVDERNFIFEGKTMLNDVCRILDIAADTFEGVKGESDSLGGLILEIAGAFPETNQVITYENFDFTILEISKMRIQKVQITVNPVEIDFDK